MLSFNKDVSYMAHTMRKRNIDMPQRSIREPFTSTQTKETQKSLRKKHPLENTGKIKIVEKEHEPS